MKKTHSLTAAFSAVQATFWMSFCMFSSFAAVYLLALGYTNAELGMILAAGSLLSALLGPGLSALIDRSARFTAKGMTPPLLAFQLAALLVLALHPQKGAVTSASFALCIAFAISVNSLNLKLYTDAVFAGAPVDYGISRGVGSGAYVLASVVMGFLTERFSVAVIPVAGIVLTAAQLASFVVFVRLAPEPPVIARSERRGASLAAFARKNRRFCVLLAGTAVLFFAHNAVSSFFINVTRNVGGDTGTMGLLNGFLAATEIPVMLLYTRLLGRRDSASLLRVAFVMFTLKAAAVAAAASVGQLAAAFLLQAPSFALYTAAIVPYVSRTVSLADSAKAQSLAFSMTTLGGVLASLIAGRLYDSLSVTQTLWITCAVCAVGSVISLLGIEKKKT